MSSRDDEPMEILADIELKDVSEEQDEVIIAPLLPLSGYDIYLLSKYGL